MPDQSALIVPVPASEAVVEGWRLRLDPVARIGVPAHITLLYPFLPPADARAQSTSLAGLFAAAPAFDFTLTAFRRFPRTGYLAPEPVAPFVHLIETLVGRWPECPPYGGAYAAIIPHLTVADDVDPPILAEVETALAPSLPIACRASEAWLLIREGTAPWTRAAAFPLAVSSALQS
jgi:hypothetical protein